MRNRKRTVALPLIAASALLAAGDSHAGSGIAVAAEVASSTCSGATVQMQIDVAVTAASAAPFTMFVSAGSGFVEAGTLANWTSHGRTKAAEATLGLQTAFGTVGNATICVAQPGANGNDSRSACVTIALPTCDGGSGSDLI